MLLSRGRLELRQANLLVVPAVRAAASADCGPRLVIAASVGLYVGLHEIALVVRVLHGVRVPLAGGCDS